MSATVSRSAGKFPQTILTFLIVFHYPRLRNKLLLFFLSFYYNDGIRGKGRDCDTIRNW